MDTEIKIRMATKEDAPALLEIYTPYVLETAVTFEIEPPSLEEFSARVERVLERYPYIVAEKDGLILGYAYAQAFRPRAAYAHSAETSIYVRKDLRSRGLGRRMYEALAKLLLLQTYSIWKRASLIAIPLMNMCPQQAAFSTPAWASSMRVVSTNAR